MTNLPSYQIQVSDAVVSEGDTVFFPTASGLGKGRVEYIKNNWVGVRSLRDHTCDRDEGRVDEWQANQLIFRPWRK